MVDRLMPVRGERSRWKAELPVEVDGGGEGEDPCGHAAYEPSRGSREMALEAKLVFERVDDRLDALADAPDRWRCALGLVSSPGPQEQPAERGHGLLEVSAGEALVGDHELARWRLALEQFE